MKKRMIKVLIATMLALTLMIGLANPQQALDTSNDITQLQVRIISLEKENIALKEQLSKLEPTMASSTYNKKSVESNYINFNDKQYIDIKSLSDLLGKNITYNNTLETFTISDKASTNTTGNNSSTVKPATPTQQKKEITVYVTKTGAKYHSSGCRYLSKSKIPIDLSNAKLSYTPCSVCNPPR